MLLVALANYDTTATISELDNELGLENTDPELNTSGIVSLIYKISTILDKIDNKADLDEILLDQGVKKLKNSEYPITSAEFISYSAATGEGTKISIRYGRPYYFCLSKNYTRKEWCDIYPIHEVEINDADNYPDAWQLFEKVNRRLDADVVGVDSSGENAYFKAAKSVRGKLLFVGGDR